MKEIWIQSVNATLGANYCTLRPILAWSPKDKSKDFGAMSYVVRALEDSDSSFLADPLKYPFEQTIAYTKDELAAKGVSPAVISSAVSALSNANDPDPAHTAFDILYKDTRFKEIAGEYADMLSEETLAQLNMCRANELFFQEWLEEEAKTDEGAKLLLAQLDDFNSVKRDTLIDTRRADLTNRITLASKIDKREKDFIDYIQPSRGEVGHGLDNYERRGETANRKHDMGVEEAPWHNKRVSNEDQLSGRASAGTAGQDSKESADSARRAVRSGRSEDTGRQEIRGILSEKTDGEEIARQNAERAKHALPPVLTLEDVQEIVKAQGIPLSNPDADLKVTVDPKTKLPALKFSIQMPEKNRRPSDIPLTETITLHATPSNFWTFSTDYQGTGEGANYSR
jgi:hypothetical protein